MLALYSKVILFMPEAAIELHNTSQSHPSPALRQLLERHLARNALIAQHVPLDIYALLIGEPSEPI